MGQEGQQGGMAAAVAAGTALAVSAACALSGVDGQQARPVPRWPLRLLGICCGMRHADANRGSLASTTSGGAAKGFEAKDLRDILSRLAAVSERLKSSGEVVGGAGRDFERELRASQPSDSTRLALQLLDERDACLARTVPVLAARLPGWEAAIRTNIS